MANIELTPEIIQLLIVEEKKLLQKEFDEKVEALEAKYQSAQIKLKTEKAIPFTDDDEKKIIDLYLASKENRAVKISKEINRSVTSTNSRISKLRFEGKLPDGKGKYTNQKAIDKAKSEEAIKAKK